MSCAIRCRSRVVWLLFGITLGGLTGCVKTRPKADVSDFAVYTKLHVLSAELGTDLEAADGRFSFKGPLTAAHMRRYFETTSGDYEAGRLRMDEMLDGRQRASAYLQIAQARVRADLAATFAKVVGPATTPSDTVPEPESTSRPTADIANAGELAGLRDALAEELKATTQAMRALEIGDSPFDRLDRVADFYAAYVLKSLRVRGDSRTINPGYLVDAILGALPTQGSYAAVRDHFGQTATRLVHKQPDLHGNRMLRVVFQTHVDPCTAPDSMAGVRVRVISGQQVDGTRVTPDVVKVLRLHPTRFYDVDNVDFDARTQQELAVSASISGSVPQYALDAALAAQRNAKLEAEERRRFLSRINKTASFAEASTHTFGFNFYPNNLQVQEKSAFDQLLGLLFFTPGKYQIKSYLEPGAWDCAAILVAPRQLASFTCDVRHVSGPIDGTLREHGPTAGRQFTVTLPPWNDVKELASTVSAGPTVRAVRAATVQPSEDNAGR